MSGSSDLTKADAVTLITILAKACGLDIDASIRQCQTESSFRCDVKNPVTGAYGLFQLEAPAATQMHVNRMEPAENIWGGLKYMRWLRDSELCGGDMRKAYAAYNWGYGHLQKLIVKHGADWEAHLPPETADYVKAILLS